MRPIQHARRATAPQRFPHRRLRALLVVLLACPAALTSAGRAADWPQFLGPTGDGTSPEKGLLRAWPASGPKVLWQVSLGKGYGGAAVRDGKVYVLDRAGTQEDVLRCLDLASGAEEWTYRYEAPGRVSHDGSRSTPAVSARHIFTIGAFGHFHCLDRVTRRVVWQKNLLSEHRTKLPNWAVAQSPLLYKDLVIAAPQSDQAGIVAYDQATGRERWRSRGLGPMAYASPKLVTLEGVDQIVIVNRNGAVAVSAANGAVLWEYAHPCRIPVPNVTALGEGRIFVTGGYNAGSAVIRVARQGARWAVQELARLENLGGHCHPALVHQGHFYVLANTNERADGLVCFDLDGRLVWQTRRNPYLCKGGSILTGDGLIYLVDGQEGVLHVIEPSPAGFKSLSQARLLTGKEIWGPLALADGKLLLRDQTQMKCVDLRSR